MMLAFIADGHGTGTLVVLAVLAVLRYVIAAAWFPFAAHRRCHGTGCGAVLRVGRGDVAAAAGGRLLALALRGRELVHVCELIDTSWAGSTSRLNGSRVYRWTGSWPSGRRRRYSRTAGTHAEIRGQSQECRI